MKMNSLDSLFALIESIAKQPRETLAPYEPRTYRERIEGHTIAELGTRSIVWMRDFHKTGQLPAELVDAITRPR
jgi:hypothetical protein